MTNDLPTNPLHGLGPAEGPRRAGEPSKAGTDQDSAAGVRFKALLEKLQIQAQELGEDSSRVESPEDLASAVDRAKTSLRDAMALRDQLVEAYREALVQPQQADDAEGGDAETERGDA